MKALLAFILILTLIFSTGVMLTGCDDSSTPDGGETDENNGGETNEGNNDETDGGNNGSEAGENNGGETDNGGNGGNIADEAPLA